MLFGIESSNQRASEYIILQIFTDGYKETEDVTQGAELCKACGCYMSVSRRKYFCHRPTQKHTDLSHNMHHSCQVWHYNRIRKYERSCIHKKILHG